jgi:F0F1-type ATP synthase assembly protein I
MIFLIIKMVLVIKYLRVKLFGQFFIKYIKTHQLKILDLYVFTNTLRIEKLFTLL